MKASKQRPRIGVTGPDQRGRILWLFNRLAVNRSGGHPVAIRPSRPVDLNRLDGLVIAGGADVDPALYGQENRTSRRLDRPRDRLESELIHWALKHHKPLLAICRGAQLMNVALGGTLHQEASEVYPRFRATVGAYRKLTLRRPIHIMKQGWLSSLIGTGKKTHLVNSLHHQAIDVVAPALEVVAIDEHGMVQALEPVDKSAFALGVQWHPEMMLQSPVQMSLFRGLIAACRRRHLFERL